MPRETYYQDPVTGERLVSNLPSTICTNNKSDPRLDPKNPAYDPNVVYDPAYTGESEYTDPVTGEIVSRPVPLNHATVSEINELKMSLGSKHEALVTAIGKLSQAQPPAEFAAAKAEVLARSADIRNHVQGFKA
jgi:hypothetical protein